MNGEQREFIGRAMVTVALLCIFGVILAVFMHFLGRRERGYLPPAPQPSGVFTREQMAKADEFSRMANVGDTNFLEKARAWAGRDVHRLICVCDICRNAGLREELRDIALNALDASRNAKASYAVFMRLARFLEECSDYPAAKEALSCAAPLARNRIEEEDRALAALRVDLASEGTTENRLGELKKYAETAAMNDNRIIAAQLLVKYEKQKQ